SSTRTTIWTASPSWTWPPIFTRTTIPTRSDLRPRRANAGALRPALLCPFITDHKPEGIPTLKILFMGTPDIAAQSLAALIDAGHEICAVYTRADKPVGRKQVLTAPPVKQLAVQHGIPVYQPATLRDGRAEEEIGRAHV